MGILTDSHKLMRYFYTPEDRPDELLQTQLTQAAETINRLVARPLKPHQLSALICLVADVEAGLAAAPNTSFEASPLVSALNKGMFQIAAGEFYTFCYTNRKMNPRAWQKRKAEQQLFITGRLLFD